MEFSIAGLFRAVARAVPERTAIVHCDQKMTYRQLDEKTDRLASVLISHGLGLQANRESLENWQSGQDHIAIYMRNRPEYIETMLAAFKARAAGFNVNFRFTETELTYLLNNAGTAAIAFESRFAPQIKSLLANSPEASSPKLLLQIDDDSDQPLLDGATNYAAEIVKGHPSSPLPSCSSDDIFILFTGGTTGMPKGVLWRQADVITTLIGTSFGTIQSLVDRIHAKPVQRFLLLPPFMHGTAQWNALSALFGGNEIHIQDNVDTLKPIEILNQIERDEINILSMVGDAFGRPICDALRSGKYDLSSLRHVLNSGAVLSDEVKSELLAVAAPNATIIDTIGASESGPQGKRTTQSSDLKKAVMPAEDTIFKASPMTVVLDENCTTLLEPGHDGDGWLAKKGTIPFGYLGDREKTLETFPVIDGVRYSVPGDRVRWREDGSIQFFGREATTINSGGEKIFAEEVEWAIKRHPSVADVIVSSRPSKRWGNEVVAIIQPESHAQIESGAILAECTKHIARYKLPKAILIVDQVKRGDNGKADQRWAKGKALSTLNSKEQAPDS